MNHDRQTAGHDEVPAAPDSKPSPAEVGTATPAEQQVAVEQVTIHSGSPPSVNREIIKGEKESARNGLIVGLIVILIGVVLLVLGVTASVDITFARGDTNGRLVTGAVGIVIALIGGAIVYWTRYVVNTTASRKDDGRHQSR